MATRIGVFFDGTGNNIGNDMAIGDGSQTNAVKLSSFLKSKDIKNNRMKLGK